MAQFEHLERAGHSTTRLGWITNPVRTTMLRFLRPYFQYIIRAYNAEIAESGRRIAEISERPAGHGEKADVPAAPLDLALDALRKDETARNHRLASIEDMIAALDARAVAGGSASAEANPGGGGATALQRSIDGLDKDQAALRARLASIEDLLASMPNAPGDPRGSHHRPEGAGGPAHALRQTLAPNMPMEIRGTSLVLHDGPYGRFLLRQPDLVSDTILDGGFWDAHLKPVIERAGSMERSAIDAGSYLGFHTVFMSRFFRSVHAFEPQVEIFRMLCTNLLLNDCHNVVATNAALYDKDIPLALGSAEHQEIPVPMHDGRPDYDRIGNAAALTFLPREDGLATSIRARTVDSLALEDLGFMKVDAQGSDLHVLRGAQETIRRCRPVIVTEFERTLSGLHQSSLQDFHDFFAQCGYSVETLADQGDGKQIDLLATPA